MPAVIGISATYDRVIAAKALALTRLGESRRRPVRGPVFLISPPNFAWRRFRGTDDFGPSEPPLLRCITPAPAVYKLGRHRRFVR